jgi:hypothetical protein
MSTHALPQVAHRSALAAAPAAAQALWLAGGLAFGFLVPFVLADTLELQRDVYYGIYAAAVAGFVALWARSTGISLRAAAARHLPWAVGLGLVAGALLALVVFRTEDATPRPDGIELAAAVVWRGLVYGAADGLLLSVFPILAVFAAFAGTRLRRSRAGTVLVALVALSASLAMTTAYHAGYSDFRGEKMAQPLRGDVVWSAPTLLTLNPVGAPIAHMTMHTAAVVHSYETDTFLPPHPAE